MLIKRMDQTKSPMTVFGAPAGSSLCLKLQEYSTPFKISRLNNYDIVQTITNIFVKLTNSASERLK